MVRAYWRWHRQWDAGAAAVAAGVLWFGAGSEFWDLFEYQASYVRGVLVNWFGAVSALFGLVAATIAFVFSVSDLGEFSPLRRSRSYAQLWQIFSFAMVVLLVATIWLGALSLMRETIIVEAPVALITLAIGCLTLLELTKFTWVLCAIVRVKAGTNRHPQ